MSATAPSVRALETLVRDLGLADRIVFTGQVADPFAVMMRARVAVCASIYEGLCNALIEALACGTPVVSTNCPYGPFEILQGGRFGALTPVGDAKAMAKAIAAALTQTPDRAALRARGFDYTAARAAERFLEIIGELDVLPARTKRPACRRERVMMQAVLQPLVKGVLRRAARYARSKPLGDAQTGAACELHVR